LAAWQEEEGSVPFDPCHGKGYVDYFVFPEQRLVQTDNLPVWVLSGWSLPCPLPWTFAGILESHSPGYSFEKYLLISASFCGLVPVQWFLIGAFPLVKPRRRWFFEPGAMITICALAWGLLILLTRMLPIAETYDVVSALTMAFELLLWLYWCVLLLWAGLHHGWLILADRSHEQPVEPACPIEK
jgi:hypothetical protein